VVTGSTRDYRYAMPTPGNKVLSKMLDRLLAGLMSGPNMNCRPHKSRQRVDLTQLAALGDASPDQTLLSLLGIEKSARTIARVKPPRKPRAEDEPRTPADKAWLDQSALLAKLRLIADDARTYENDTGVHALSIGFPLLSLPPGSFAGGSRNSTKRILAPIAFIPVTLILKGGATPSVDLACRGEGADRVTPNTALLSWIEQQTGKPQTPDAFEDEEGVDPWREISELVKHVADAMRIQAPKLPIPQTPKPEPTAGDSQGAQSPPRPGSEVPQRSGSNDEPSNIAECPAESPAEPPAEPTPKGETPMLHPAPRPDDDTAEPAILLSAVLGLFPTTRQGLVRDTRAMLADEKSMTGPIQSFLTSGIDFDAPIITTPLPGPQPTKQRTLASERLAAAADPCQARAVALAREAAGLVIHGPPGTGKSQTITNIIADHLSRGQRVLLVCEKRTALDVVADRLEHMNLRSLCGIVHDPQRDQRELYKSVHEQLDELPEASLHPRADADLQKVNTELQQLHDELTRYHKSLMEPVVDGGPSFHDLMGRWMASRSDSAARVDDTAIANITAEELESQRVALSEVFDRAASVDYSRNPWSKCAGISLGDFLSRPMENVRTALGRILAAADSADAAADHRIPPFTDDPHVQQQAAARAGITEPLAVAIPNAVTSGLAFLAAQDMTAVRKAKAKLDTVEGEIAIFHARPIDPRFHSFLSLSIPQIAPDVLALQKYMAVSKKWYGIFCFGVKSEAAKVLKKFGLSLTLAAAGDVIDFLTGLRARLILSEFVGETKAAPDDRIEQYLKSAAEWFPLLERIATDPALTGIAAVLARMIFSPVATHPTDTFNEGPEDRAVDGAPHEHTPALRTGAKPGLLSVDDFLQGLRLSPARADAIVHLEEQFAASTLLDPKWLADFSASPRSGKLARDTAAALTEKLPQLEGVLRVRAGRAALAENLGPIADQILSQIATANEAITAIEQKVLSNEITRRLRDNPTLQAIDGHRIDTSFDRFRELDKQKKQLVQKCIAHHWVSKQKERLLAGTGKRLNSAGADLRRRLITRGTRAMRLRQVIAIGSTIEGGDPLLDLCPVWMASPETVAQIFPRTAMFDVIIFDEASQCRLEEALPVLTRGRRVVIAGDPHQLPPTRFFESGFVQSEDEDPETDQELFESQQGEVEDLLAAALNLSIQQCYLDVHYRSRNADLIEFSNRNFYSSRLQAIPGHPANRSKFAPLTLYRVDGTYNKRQNQAEADRVVQIVRDLLKRASPPSIGIACLNLPQRDLIMEKLDDLAGEDADFGKRLATARTRKGQGSFEGLFVKNLENVQGDERDDIIISTTYGPDTSGKFYRRFGPLGMTGGGRRLNVLVTRARNEVHLVTSIPAESYRSLPVVPDGQSATGAWLLFAYLKFAEELTALYENANVERSTSNIQPRSEQPAAHVLPSRSPSVFAQNLAQSLAQNPKIGSDVHWGNEGFCVDLALHHPSRPGDVTIGLLCDGCRYSGADDVVEWDIFRTGILEDQGWILRRIWTPHFFRDPAGDVLRIRAAAVEFVESEKPVDALPTMVQPPV
jgi:hypothetical protein